LYVGPVSGATMTKISSPATAPSAATVVASTLNGQGVNNMAFNGFDLYMTENGNPNQDSIARTGANTEILNAAPSLNRGRAIPFTGFPISGTVNTKGAKLPIDVDVPLAMTIGPTGAVPCQTRVSNYPSTLPSIYIGGAAEVDQWSFLCSISTVWVDQGQ